MRVEHAHGTRAAYVADRCRCLDCTAANTRAEAARRRASCYGRWAPWVPADPVRRHVRQLTAAGMGLRRIAQLSGVGYSTLCRLLRDEPAADRPASRRVRSGTAQAVLSVPATVGPAPGARIDATGTHRRLQALMALGWSSAELARRLGRSDASLRRCLTQRNVTAATATAVHALYDELSGTPATEDTATEEVDRRRDIARNHGWFPPLAWDDIDTDPEPAPPLEPDAAIDQFDIEVALARVTAGQSVRLSRNERDEVIHRLTERGHSLPQIAGYLGICPRTVSRTRRAHRVA